MVSFDYSYYPNALMPVVSFNFFFWTDLLCEKSVSFVKNRSCTTQICIRKISVKSIWVFVVNDEWYECSILCHCWETSAVVIVIKFMGKKHVSNEYSGVVRQPKLMHLQCRTNNIFYEMNMIC